MAESQLLKAVRDGNMTGIIFWLKNNHPDYKNKIEVSGKLEANGTLTLEQETAIQHALVLAGLVTKPTQPLLDSNQNGNT